GAARGRQARARDDRAQARGRACVPASLARACARARRAARSAQGAAAPGCPEARRRRPGAPRPRRRGLHGAAAPRAPRAQPLGGVEVGWWAGLGSAEAVGLDLGDVDFEQELVHVRRGKGAKDRVVPLGEEAALWVARYLRDARPALARGANDALFLSATGRRL